MDDFGFGPDSQAEQDQNPAAQGFAMHHIMPLMLHSDESEILMLPTLPAIDDKRARKPQSPYMPLLQLLPLPSPDSYRMTLPLRPGAEDLVLDTAQSLFSGSPGSLPVGASAGAPSSGSMPAQAPQMTRPLVTPDIVQQFDPVYPFIVLLALGLGTLYMNLDILSRYTIMWTVLTAFGAFFWVFDGGKDAQGGGDVSGLGWGVSFGLVFGLPLLILVSSGLAMMSGVLFPGAAGSTRFLLLAFAAPMGETLFFRGTLQERRGLASGILGAGLMGVLIFWPAAIATPGYLVAAGLFSTVLAGIYGFVHLRYGLAAAFVCQLTINLMLLYIPGLFGG